MPPGEVERDRRIRRGEDPASPPPALAAVANRLNMASIATAARAAVSWKRQASQADDLEVS